MLAMRPVFRLAPDSCAARSAQRSQARSRGDRFGFVVVGLLAQAGCAQLFGIDVTSAPDAQADFATVQVQRVSVGATIVRSPQDLMGQTASFLTDDGAGGLTPVAGMQATQDSFIADVPGTPPVLFTVPDDTTPRLLWATPARLQRGNLYVFEHPNAQPPVMGSQIALDVALPTPYVTGESFRIEAIGAWMQRALGAAELPGIDNGATRIMPATPIDYMTFTPMLGQDPARITRADQVLVLRYANETLTGVLQSQFDQTEGVDTISGTMTAVVATETVMATIDPPSYTTRFTAVRPAVAGLVQSWRVHAAPGWALGIDSGVLLRNGTSPSTDTGLTTMFGNPLEALDWRALFTFTTTSSRTFVYTQDEVSRSMTLSASMVMIAEPTAATINVTMPAGLPSTIRLNLTPLTNDGMTLTLDLSRPVEIDAIVDRPSNTFYEMALVQVDLSDDMTQIERTIVASAITTGEPQFRLPPELFAVGKSYYIRFRSHQGLYPQAAAGDLQTTAVPRSASALDSAVFTVGMP
jgi:hypothetical protein